MTCPQCQEAVPASALWTSGGLSNVICTKCGTHLKPTPGSTILIFVLSFGLAEAALLVLKRMGTAYWLPFVGFFAVFALIFALGTPLILRFQYKERKENPLTGTSH
jgi:hypothetical protein